MEEGRGARLRAGQYAQTGSGSGGINEMGRKILWTARKGGVGGRLANTGGGAMPLP